MSNFMQEVSDTSKQPSKRGRPFGSNAKGTRKRLIDAAIEHFNKDSYAEVSMARIASSAGLTGAAIYNHFSSKDELFIATISHHIATYNEMITQAVSISGSWKAKLNNLLAAAAPLHDCVPGFSMIGSVVIDRLQKEPEKFQVLRDFRESSAEVFRGLVAEGVDCGDLPKDTDVVIAGEVLMAIAASTVNIVSFYHPRLETIHPIVESVRALLGTRS